MSRAPWYDPFTLECHAVIDFTVWGLNPCPAELFKLYFSSFEAGIALAIPASNDEKYFYFLKIYIFLIEL